MRARVTIAAGIERERAIEVLRALVFVRQQFGLWSSDGHAGISRSVDTSMLREHRLVNNGTEH